VFVCLCVHRARASRASGDSTSIPSSWRVEHCLFRLFEKVQIVKPSRISFDEDDGGDDEEYEEEKEEEEKEEVFLRLRPWL